MPVPWRLIKIDTSQDTHSPSYRNKRETQISRWKKKHTSNNVSNSIAHKEDDIVIHHHNKETNKCTIEGNTDKDKKEINKDIFKKPREHENKRQNNKKFSLDHNRRKGKVERVFLNGRVEKAKDIFTREHKKFLEDAIQKYKEYGKDAYCYIPDIKAAIQMSIDSLTFPKQELEMLGDGENGKLCDLEPGWSPSVTLDHVPDIYTHPTLPNHIKQPKTIGEREKERIFKAKQGSEQVKRQFDPVIDLSYLFS